MFNTIKTFLFGEPITLELTEVKAQTTKETTMSSTVGYIRQMKNGKFRLLHNGNEVAGTYTRRRDAVRGADRRGIAIAA